MVKEFGGQLVQADGAQQDVEPAHDERAQCFASSGIVRREAKRVPRLVLQWTDAC